MVGFFVLNVQYVHYIKCDKRGDEMKRLYRSQYDRKIAGICGGLAKYFNLDPTIIRIIMVILFLFTLGFPVLVGYVLAVFIIPNDEDVAE